MTLNRAIVLLACLSLSASLASAVTLNAAYTTTAPSDESCNPGPRSTSFFTTSSTVWLYVDVSNANAGDVLAVEWIRPGGEVYLSSEFEPLPSAGDYCFDVGIDIAGQSAAGYPGTWSVAGYWNGNGLFSTNFTLTQGTATCSYALGSTSINVPAAASDGSVSVITASECDWTAVSNVSWVTITAGASGTGNGTVGYSVDANASASSRTGTLSIADQTFTITQAGTGGPGPTPTIAAGGIVNAASNMPPSVPAGDISRGAYFTIYGTDLGPSDGMAQPTYPLPTTLAGVSVQVRHQDQTANAYMVYASAQQVNAVMPSDVPTGDSEIVVIYNGVASEPAPVEITDGVFGIFSLAGGMGPGIIQNYVSPTEMPLNSRSTTAQPGQVAVLLGTGLGPITEPDNIEPPVGDLYVYPQLWVGGVEAEIQYAGRMPGVAAVDQINFVVPLDAPYGCYVPVQLQVGNVYSNFVTMAIDPYGEPCSDPYNPFASVVTEGRRGGSVFLVRAGVNAKLSGSPLGINATVDLGVAAFEDTTGLMGGDSSFNPIFSLPPVGTCMAYAGNFDISGLLGGDLGGATSGAAGLLGQDLDAGQTISVTSPQGTTIDLKHFNTKTNTGPYWGLLGGLSLSGQALPPFLNPGTFTISGPGGADVGPFQASITITSLFNWDNSDQITQVDRGAPLQFMWSPADESQLVLIGGASTDSTTKAVAGFFCFVPAGPGSFIVPPSVLSNLPASTGSKSLGALLIGSFPAGDYPTFSASGLDSGLVFNATLSGKTVSFY